MLQIIEDCSPYYIRFKHDGFQNIVDTAASYIDQVVFDTGKLKMHKLPIEEGAKLLSMIPFGHHFKFNPNRVTLFASQPGFYYRPHKDHLEHRFGLNYPILVQDDKCVTGWYSDEELAEYEVDPTANHTILKSGYSRDVVGFVKNKHTPAKTLIAKPDECMLINTDIFHDWDNSKSSNLRVILTLRLELETTGSVYFEDARKIIFGY